MQAGGPHSATLIPPLHAPMGAPKFHVMSKGVANSLAPNSEREVKGHCVFSALVAGGAKARI